MIEMDVIIPTGSTIYLSDIGHKGFFYPNTDKPETVFADTLGEKLPWIGGNNMLIPVKISRSSIYATDRSNGKVVVWVKGLK